MNAPRLHIITDDATLADPGFARTAEALLEAGGNRVGLHVRGHATNARALLDSARGAALAARRTGSQVLVNDRIDVALAAAAHGVQLGTRSVPVREARRLLPAASIGVSVHAVAEIGAAAEDGADFAILGAIWDSATHPGRPGSGPGLLSAAAAASPIDVVAIGGVTPERVAVALQAGARGVAVLSGIWAAADPIAAVEAYLGALAGVDRRAAPMEKEVQ